MMMMAVLCCVARHVSCCVARHVSCVLLPAKLNCVTLFSFAVLPQFRQNRDQNKLVRNKGFET